MRWIFLALALVNAGEILVLLDSLAYKDSHSQFFDSISSRGHKLTYKKVENQGTRLEKYDEYLYSAVILLCSSTEDLGGKISVSELLKFSDNGGSLIVFADTDAGAQYRKLANEFGIDFHEQGTRLYGESKVLKTNNITGPSIIVPASKEKVLFSGIGMNYNKDSRFLTPLLSTNAKNIVRNEFKVSEVSGSSHVVLAFQGRNNARAIFSGSIDICSNSHSEKNYNQKFCLEFAKWVLNEKGVLRVSSITHHRQNEKREKGYLEGEYTINDDLYYLIEIEENVDGKWQRFKTDNAYLEFVMMDPRIRKYLANDKDGLVSQFKAPDVHGVYQFKTFLYEHGYSWIETANKVTVRPYRHNQFERFLVCASPYYLSVFVSIAGFIVFSFSFLFHKNN